MSVRLPSLLIAAAICGTAVAQISPQRVYICPDDHTDYFWAADEATYRAAFLRMIDYYINLADTTATNPPDRQSRFNCDGSFWLWEYERNRPAAQWDRLIAKIRSGHISVALNPLVLNNGGSPAEAVIRGMYYAGRIERRHDLRFRLGIYMENQSFPCGLPSLWAGSGATYSWKGICGCDTLISGGVRPQEIYRALGPDGSGVLMKWHSMLNGNESIGGYAEARFPSASVDYVTVNAPFNGFRARYPFDVIGVFGKGWDDIETLTSEFVTVAGASSNASRRVIVSNAVDFFDDFSATYSVPALPAVTLSYGNEWDAYAASMQELSSRMKRTTEKLRTAEALASLVSIAAPGIGAGREPQRDAAFMKMGLFYEHNMGMVGNPTGGAGVTARIAWQRQACTEAETYINDLCVDAAAELGAQIPAQGARFFAFNPLSWTRSDAADLPWSDPQPAHVVEVGTGLEVPSQIVTVDGQRRMRIWATELPPVGYKVYQIVAGPGQTFADAAVVAGAQIENARYRLVVQPRGAITTLVDKANGNRQIASTFGGRAVNDLGSATGAISVENTGPVSVTLVATASAPVAHTSRITLFRDGDRIDLSNRITQNFTATQRWGFSFALTSPTLTHEELGTVLTGKLSSAGGHYAPSFARYDLLTLNHFADLAESSGYGVTISSADCSFMTRGSSTAGSLDTSTPAITVIAGGQVVNGSNGLPAQAGDTSFTQRFALRTHGPSNQAGAMRASMEHQNPPWCGLVTGTAPALPANSLSFFASSNPDVMIHVVKPAEDGPAAPDGPLTLRLWNLSASAASTTLSAHLPITHAAAATHLETIDPAIGPAPVLSAGAMQVTLAPQQMRTFRVALGCPSDVNSDGGVDGDDVIAFFGWWDAGLINADFNSDGGVDGDDVIAFFGAWDAGC